MVFSIETTYIPYICLRLHSIYLLKHMICGDHMGTQTTDLLVVRVKVHI